MNSLFDKRRSRLAYGQDISGSGRAGKLYSVSAVHVGPWESGMFDVTFDASLEPIIGRLGTSVHFDLVSVYVPFAAIMCSISIAGATWAASQNDVPTCLVVPIMQA